MAGLGLLLYTSFMRERTFRSALLVPYAAQLFVHLVDVLLYTRVNRTLGIPDVVFVLGTECRTEEDGSPDPIKEHGRPDPMKGVGSPDPMKEHGTPDPIERGRSVASTPPW